MLTSDTVGTLALDDFVETTSQIYRHHDRRRSVWDIWLHACHHASSLSIAIRSGDKSPAEEMAHVSMWLFTFVQQIKGKIAFHLPGDKREEETVIRTADKLSDMLWRNYPRICPECYWRRTNQGRQDPVPEDMMDNTCDCEEHNRHKEGFVDHLTSVRAYARSKALSRPTTIDEWQEMLISLHSPPKDGQTAVLDLLEAMGQVGDGILRLYTYHANKPPTTEEVTKRYLRFEREFTRTVACLFVLTQLEVFNNKEITIRCQLSQLIWNTYGQANSNSFWCSTCKGYPCCCDIILIPSRLRAAEIRTALEGS